jgi:hypothetical protein
MNCKPHPQVHRPSLRIIRPTHLFTVSIRHAQPPHTRIPPPNPGHPPWQQDSKHILTNYRPLSTSHSKTPLSLFHLHNQTLNIYTHLLGFCLFSILAYILRNSLHTRYATTTKDTVVSAAFFVSVLARFGFSTAYQSWVPGVYHGSYCQRGVCGFYMVLVSNSHEFRSSVF